jgi:hypothetical protein
MDVWTQYPDSDVLWKKSAMQEIYAVAGATHIVSELRVREDIHVGKAGRNAEQAREERVEACLESNSSSVYLDIFGKGPAGRYRCG